MNKDYLAGFIEAKGIFTIILQNWRYIPHFAIQLRDDNRHILEEIQKALHVTTKLQRSIPKTNANPLVKLYLSSADNNLRLISFLGDNPFIGNKRPQYEIWKKAVIYYNETKGSYPHNAYRKPEKVRIQLEKYYYLLKELKKYRQR